MQEEIAAELSDSEHKICQLQQDEMQTVIGELQEVGITQTEREYLLEEVRKPLDIDAVVRALPNRQVDAQIDAASLLAVEVDVPAERACLQNLPRNWIWMLTWSAKLMPQSAWLEPSRKPIRSGNPVCGADPMRYGLGKPDLRSYV